ncbi:MAG: glycosyltransferase [Deltaproteobacteria bacterium]|nr:glycosyltransferase [Deltaproteobacteria bacterium]
MEISVIIPVYNGGDKLQKCISALKRQKTSRPYELIIVDDGSTDGGLQKVKEDGFKVFRQANQGPAAARNLGVANANGKIVLFTDADCEPTEDWIEQMVSYLEDPSISAVKGSYLTKQKGIVPRFVQLEYESKYERMKKDRYIDFIDTYAAGFKIEDFLRVGKYDTQFTTASVEDQEFSFRMWGQGYRMVFNPEAKVYHTHSGTLWNYAKKKFRIGFWKALVLKRHPKKIARDSHTPQSLKLEMVFATLLLISLLASLLKDAFLVGALISLIGFFVTSLPFVFGAFRKDPLITLFFPVLLFVRALSLSLGLMVGAWNFYVLKEEIKGEGALEQRREQTAYLPNQSGGIITACLQKGSRILSLLVFWWS